MDKDKCYLELITELYDIHPISVMAELSEKCKHQRLNNKNGYPISQSSNFTRAGKLFPQNKVTLDLLNKTKLYEPKLFTSLESAWLLLTKAEEDATAGNNANYSFMGGLAGSVTDEEENGEKLYPEGDPSPDTIKFHGSESLYEIDKEAYTMQLNNIVDGYNKLFKKVILNEEKIILGIK
jgi:hypothetical protein